MSQERYENLLARIQTLHDLQGIGGIAMWDMNTHMPPRGAEVRGQRLSTLTRIAHGMLTEPATGELIDGAEEYVRHQGEESIEYAIWRKFKRNFEKSTLIPTELAAEMNLAKSRARVAWIEARKNNDFASFKPFLQQNVEHLLQSVELLRGLFPDAEEDYDILLDDYEEGMKTSEVAEVFDTFKAGAAPLIEKVAAQAGDGRDAAVHKHFPTAQQDALVRRIAKAVGFSDDSWDLTTTTHPFASAMSINDVRITTKFEEDFFNPSFFGTLHEFGHGLYEHQVNPEFDRTPLARGVSMAWHESQSRMWENLVGRGLPFWKWAAPVVKEQFPEQFDGMDAEDIYRAVNLMGPSLIRIEADELTYNFHIIVRFELEREIISGRLSVDDLPEAWNAKYKEYLGVDVPSDSDGVLQDVHWSGGSMGYFPTYALGNVLGAMLWQRITTDLPNLESEFEQGEFGSLREWSRENVHRHGSHHTPGDLLQKVLGTRTLDAQPLLDYLTVKVDRLYG